MDKPKPQAGPVALDWNDCVKYIESKLEGRRIRDWAGTSIDGGNRSAPYQDFWHVIIDMYKVHNGGYFDMCMDKEEYKEAWHREVLAEFQKHFDEYVNEGYLAFSVWW